MIRVRVEFDVASSDLSSGVAEVTNKLYNVGQSPAVKWAVRSARRYDDEKVPDPIPPGPGTFVHRGH